MYIYSWLSQDFIHIPVRDLPMEYLAPYGVTYEDLELEGEEATLTLKHSDFLRLKEKLILNRP